MDSFAEAARRAAAGAQPEPPPPRSAPAPRPEPHGELVLHHQADPALMALAVDPVTGEAFTEPAEIPTDDLAQLAFHLRMAAADQQVWRRAVDRELVTRLHREHKRKVTVGAYELELVARAGLPTILDVRQLRDG